MTNNVQRLVDRYEGWEKESGVTGVGRVNSRELFRFGQTPGEDQAGSPMKRWRLEGHDTGPPPGPQARHLSSSSPGPRPSPKRCPGTRGRWPSTSASRCPAPSAAATTSSSQAAMKRDTRWTACRWPPSCGTQGSTAPSPHFSRGRPKEHEIAPVGQNSVLDNRLTKPGREHPP